MVFKDELMQIRGSDSSRVLICETKDIISKIGNALGLARLLRSAKLFNASKSRQYSSTHNLKSLKFNRNHPAAAQAQMLEAILDPPLSKAASDFFPNTSFAHNLPCEQKSLENLHILYPALSLLWLEASASGKDMLRKKIKTSEGYYTDDGFALGYAYFFEVLEPEQCKNFNAMNWRQSSTEKFVRMKTEMKVKAESILGESSQFQSNSMFNASLDQAIPPDEDSEYTRLQVLAKRLEMRRRELELLHYSMHVSRMIFSCT